MSGRGLCGEEDIGWKDLNMRSTRDSICRFLSSETATTLIEYESLESIVSVGTAEGDVDKYFLSLCPNLKEYIGIEPVTDRSKEAKGKISSSNPTVKVDFVNGYFEDYQCGDSQVDAVLLFHSIYFFGDNLRNMITKAMSMVKHGGKVIILVAYGLPQQQYLMKRIDVAIREGIKELNYKFVEDDIEPMLIDLSVEGFGYYGFIDLFMAEKVTKEEKDKILAQLYEEVVPGTHSMARNQKAFILYK